MKNGGKLSVLSVLLLVIFVVALSVPASAMGRMNTQPSVSGTVPTTGMRGYTTGYPQYLSSPYGVPTYSNYIPPQNMPTYTGRVWTQAEGDYWSGYNVGLTVANQATTYNPPNCLIPNPNYCRGVRQGFYEGYNQRIGGTVPGMIGVMYGR